MKGIKKVKFFENFDSEQDTDNLVLTKRQLSNVCAILIFLFMLVFTLGYFWGKKNAVEAFVDKTINESFEDKVNYSLYSLYNNANQEEDIIVEESAQEPTIDASNINQASKEEDLVMPEPEASAPGVYYYSELIGFSTEKAANDFLEKVKAKGYPIKIIAKKSVSPKGKSVVWYQAVTEKMSDKNVLNDITKQIEKSERLAGTKIITVKI